MPNLAQRRSLSIRELQPPLQQVPQDAVFCNQIFIAQQEVLVHRPRDVSQDARPLHRFPRLPTSRKKVADSARRGYAGME
jgi:hypothetical protein